jgi:hypothetical protein
LFLKKAILNAAGAEVEDAYDIEFKNHPNSLLISIPSGQLVCKRILFIKWEPNEDETILRQTIVDFISNAIQTAIQFKFTSIAFPAIGCGLHGCSSVLVIKTMVNEIKKQLIIRKLIWRIKFVVLPKNEEIYDEFCDEVLAENRGKTCLSCLRSNFRFNHSFCTMI